jgi:hypothetical protein
MSSLYLLAHHEPTILSLATAAPVVVALAGAWLASRLRPVSDDAPASVDVDGGDSADRSADPTIRHTHTEGGI